MNTYSYLKNEEMLSTNNSLPYQTSGISHYPNLIPDYRHNQELKKRLKDEEDNRDIRDKMNYDNGLNYNTNWDWRMNKDNKKELELRRNRVRSEFDWNPNWDYHLLFKTKTSNNLNDPFSKFYKISKHKMTPNEQMTNTNKKLFRLRYVEIENEKSDFMGKPFTTKVVKNDLIKHIDLKTDKSFKLQLELNN